MRIVVKVGSNVLTRADGTLDVTRVSSLADQLAQLYAEGNEIILVTSGAVACGRSILGPEKGLDEVEQRQVYSAVGQVRLMDLYHTLLGNYGINIGQVLTMKENFNPGKAYSNQKGCIEAMLRSRVLPIVNENDTVSITELMFTDNDELSGLIARMMDTVMLVLLTNVDGVLDENKEVIRKIRPGEDFSSCIKSGKSTSGRGGMVSKYGVASSLAAEGICVMIANGNRDGILTSLLNDPDSVPHTEFAAK